jgi:hypothetical protein
MCSADPEENRSDPYDPQFETLRFKACALMRVSRVAYVACGVHVCAWRACACMCGYVAFLK